jgi:hypothetical protein
MPPTLTEDQQLASVVDVLEAISIAEDAVLSIIAAFIGHVHSHHMGSHPSSHEILIEMTRETIDCVRELLTVVEAVGRDLGVRKARPKDVENMRLSKDTLYEVSNRLVEGVQLIAHAPFTDTTEEEYDGVKSQILSTATATLRAATECVRWVSRKVVINSLPRHPHLVIQRRLRGSQLRDQPLGTQHSCFARRPLVSEGPIPSLDCIAKHRV